MSELAMRTDSSAALIPADTATFDRLASWARAAVAAHEIAESLVRTSFVPEAFKGKAHEATAAILAGAEVGLDPMASLRSFDIIQGTAAPRAMTLRAVLQSKGHQIWVEESTATRAIVMGIRFGETKVHKSTWTLDRAKGMNLLGKDNWRKQPQAMLVARATSECARLTASDAILGIAYSSEELDDEGTVAPDVAPEAKPARRTAQRAVRAAAEPAPEPEFDEPGTPPAAGEPVDPDDVELITKPQQAKLHACLAELGKGERSAGLALIGEILGREIDTTKKLTKADAMTVIDDLDAQLMAKRNPEPTMDDDWPETATPPDGDV